MESMDLLIPGEPWTLHLTLLEAGLKGSILFRYPWQGPVHRPEGSREASEDPVLITLPQTIHP